jgi:hypothetical protein
VASRELKQDWAGQILEGLHNTSVEILQKWNAEAKPLLKKNYNADTGEALPPMAHEHGGNQGGLTRSRVTAEVSFVLGDITDPSCHDWTDGDVLFANSTCFDEKVRDIR